MISSSVAGNYLKPYIRSMEHGALTEETRRFAVALAAANVSGREISMIDGPLEIERRSYFYATPEEDDRFSLARLKEVVADTKCPVLVDWDRKSDHYGLLYTVKGEPTRSDLKEFQSEDAVKDWSAWRSKIKAADRVVALAAQEAVRGKPLSFLDADITKSVPEKPSRKTDLEL